MFLKWKTILLISFIASHVYCNEKGVCDKEEVEIYSELNGLNQNDPKLIEALKNNILLKPKQAKLNLKHSPSPKFLRGQYGQPYEVEDILKKHKVWKKIKKRKQPGFFIEAGASGGAYLLNSLYSEVKHNWTGLLVEASPDFLEELTNKNRYCLFTFKKPFCQIW